MTLARFQPPSNLRDLVSSAFSRAVASGEVHFFPTQACILPINSIPFQLRFSPSLANKPKSPPQPNANGTKAFDPFTNPPAGMLITRPGPAHFLLLNKFAIVPEHFILATEEYKLQDHILEQDDLEATLACIRAYHPSTSPTTRTPSATHDDDGLFAFFNSGKHSGASQPHRHIQLLPEKRMSVDLPPSAWTVLASNPHSLQTLPFLTFVEPLAEDISARDLHATYLRLYRRACRAVALHTGDQLLLQEDLETQVTGKAAISYNLALTRETMVLCPRLAEGAEIVDRPTGRVLGCLSLNGTLLAGTALVKNEMEWDALKRHHPEGLTSVLRRIGVPREFEEGKL